MRRSSRRIALVSVLGSLACDRASDPPQNPEPAPASVEPAPVPIQPEVAINIELSLPEIPAESPARTPEQIRELHQQYRELLREARAKREANELDGALADYRALLEIDPTDATALGELADVAVALTHFELAEAALVRALRYARDDAAKQRTMVQLGGVAERRGEAEQAAIHYRAALVLREDPELRKRLNRLSIGCKPAPADSTTAPTCQGLTTLGEGFATLAQACRRAAEALAGCDKHDRCDELDEESLEEACEEPYQEGGGALVYTYDKLGESGWHYVFPVVRTPLGWTVFDQIALIVNPGINGMTAEWDIDESLHRVSGSPSRTYYVIDYDFTNRDIDAGDGEDRLEGERGVVLCRVDDLRALCTAAFVYGTESSLQLDNGKYEYNDVSDGEYSLKGGTVTVRMGKRKTEYVIEDELARD